MKYFIAGLLLFIWIGCNSKPQMTSIPQKREFKMVEVPITIVEPAQRANYLAQHYWDNFDFTDTAYIHLPDVTEQAFANYVNMLDYTSSPKIVSQAIKGMLTKAEADTAMFAYFCKLYDKYLYDPNSPLRNEEYYIPVLEKIISSNKVEDVNKIRPQHHLELALKNRRGQQANDFYYTLASGATGHLHGIQAPYIILFFYNPDCSMCKEVHEEMAASPLLNQLQKEKQLRILALYPDEDIEAWKKHLSAIPPQWINGYDKELFIRNEEAYDLKAIPTLYLLDKDKKVVLKDVSFPQIEAYFQQLQEKK